jgi:hypothetical protein
MRCRKLNLLRICHGLGSELTVSPVPRWSLRPALARRGARPLRSQYPLAASPLSRHPWPAGSLTYPHRRPGLCSRSGKRGSVRTASQSLSFRDNATLCAGECLQVELASYSAICLWAPSRAAAPSSNREVPYRVLRMLRCKPRRYPKSLRL